MGVKTGRYPLGKTGREWYAGRYALGKTGREWHAHTLEMYGNVKIDSNIYGQ